MKDVLNGPIKLDNIKEVPSPEGEESLALPDSSSPKKKAEMVLQQYQANEYLMDAQYVSYILIDSKNHQNSHLPHQLWKLNPFEAGIEPERTEEDPTTVPYLAIAMYYDGKKVHRIKKLPTYKKGQKEPDNFASIALYNAHQNFPNVASEFAELLRATDGIDLAPEGEDRIIKYVQKFGVKGTKMPDKKLISRTNIDTGSSVGVTSRAFKQKSETVRLIWINIFDGEGQGY